MKTTVEMLPNMTSEFTLASWLISGNFHLAWNQWLVSLVHLRGKVDGEPSKIVLEGATHELTIWSIHPDAPALSALSTIDDLVFVEPSSNTRISIFLNPVDICQQLIAKNDAEAMAKVETVLTMVANNRLSPDSDFRKLWFHYLTECSVIDELAGISR